MRRHRPYINSAIAPTIIRTVPFRAAANRTSTSNSSIASRNKAVNNRPVTTRLSSRQLTPEAMRLPALSRVRISVVVSAMIRQPLHVDGRAAGYEHDLPAGFTRKQPGDLVCIEQAHVAQMLAPAQITTGHRR